MANDQCYCFKMQNCIVLLIILSGLNKICVTSSTVDNDSDIADFDFETISDLNRDYYYDSSVNDPKLQDRIDTVDDSNDRTTADDYHHHHHHHQPSNVFAAKELKIRNAVLRATKNELYTRKFAQILPIMRSLSKQQRVVLASLITAQASAAPGAGLNLAQVYYFELKVKKLIELSAWYI